MATAKKKRKRRKGKRYKTGVHKSPKCKTPIKYRSGWELTVCKHLDNNPLVVEYAYEAIKIPYVSNQRTKKIRYYLPDFLVTYADGRKLLIEVKRTSALEQLIVKKKAAAARECAKKHNAEYTFWSNEIIAILEKTEKQKEKLLSS